MNDNFFDDLTEDTYEIVNVLAEDGTITECFVIDDIIVDNYQYLLVVKSDDFENEEPEAFILKQIQDDNEEIIYEPVENEAEYNKVLILLQENEGDYEMTF